VCSVIPFCASGLTCTSSGDSQCQQCNPGYLLYDQSSPFPDSCVVAPPNKFEQFMFAGIAGLIGAFLVGAVVIFFSRKNQGQNPPQTLSTEELSDVELENQNI